MFDTAKAVFRSHGAILSLASGNRKTGRVAATYLPISRTCPDTCAMKEERSCYAQAFRMYPWGRDLEATPGDAFPSLAEAWLIEAAADAGKARGSMLRSHVSGDTTDPADARRLAQAWRYWQSKGGGRVWKYTHAWRSVHRFEYGAFAGEVLASVDHYSEIPLARAQGYRSIAIAVPKFHGDRAFSLPDGTKAVPCPAQTGRADNCEQCKLCTRSGVVVAFEAHGTNKRKLAERLSDGRVHLSVQ